MDHEDSFLFVGRGPGLSRRQLLGGAFAAAATPLLVAATSLAADVSPSPTTPTVPQRKIKLGVVGCGGRGSWIAGLFKEHGGYEIDALADYFPQTAQRCGDALGVDRKRCFSGLSGYKRVIESGVEAVALETPPCFFPEHAAAAVDAGLHTYMAKPAAVDVPGCLAIEAAGKLATLKGRVFHVDYQIPTEPANIQVAERVRKGEMGKPAKVVTATIGGYHHDPPKTATIESRLQNNVWGNDLAIGGGVITFFDIHMLDAALWILGQRPVAAMGESCIRRPDPHGDNPDVYSIIYDYADGPLHTHAGLVLPTGASGEMKCTIYGQTGHAVVNYDGQSRFHVRGEHPFVAQVENLYLNGAKRNIAMFYQSVCENRYENPTVRRAVDGCLTCILGREAAARKGRLTMDELIRENKRLELDLSGLKV